MTEEHDRGLSFDLPTLLSRRAALGLFGGAGLSAALAACTGSSSPATAPGTPSASTATSSSPAGRSSAAGRSSPASSSKPAAAEGGTDVQTSRDGRGAGEIPEETGGPFPADGSNGVDVLGRSGIVRSDIRSSFGTATTRAAGVPLTLELTVVDVSGSKDAGTAVRGAAVYVWHCDREGRYSLYDQGVTEENYLRGVQATGADGTVRFTTVFPGAYSGRWPHVHFEVYPTLRDATAASNRLRTSQLALPKAVCDAVYATEGYEQSVGNLAQVSLADDLVFRDGWTLQLPRVRGSVDRGYSATLRVPV